MKAPISVCLICRDDENTLEACLLSLKDYVEEIIVVDTGSIDSSPKIAQKYATKFEVFTDCNNSENGLIEDFSKARNYSFSLATQPWVMWVDADDIITGCDNLIGLCKFNGKDNMCYLFPYEYSYDQQGKCNLVHYRERLVNNKSKFNWVNPVHEVLLPLEPEKTVSANFDGIVFKHQRQFHAKLFEPNRNLRIIEKYVEENGEKDARQLYYLGLELFNHNRMDEAYKTFSRYVELSGWDDEKCMAILKLVEVCFKKSDYRDGVNWAFKAIQTKENWGEGYFAAARMYYFLAEKGGPMENRNWQKCIHFANLGLSMEPTKTLLFVNPNERAHDIYLYLNIAYNKIGNVTAALAATNKGLEAVPDSQFLLHNKKLYDEFFKKEKNLTQIAKLRESGDLDSDLCDLLDTVVNKGITQVNASSGEALYSANGKFPKPRETSNPDCWTIPSSWNFDGFPLELNEAQLQAMVIAMWKQYMLHDELLSAIKFLEHAPYNVRHSPETEKALRITKSCMEWMDNPKLTQKVNAPENPHVEIDAPMPQDLRPYSQSTNRFNFVKNSLAPGKHKMVDFGCVDGCFTNRYAMLGHEVLGLDLCETSVALANKKAAEFNTGAKHIVTYFQNALDKVEQGYFDYGSSTDTYEHLRTPVQDMLIPAYKMLNENGKFLMATPHGAWMRGNYVPWAHPWLWYNEGSHWLSQKPRAHLIAPTVWSTAQHFREAGFYVYNSYVGLCENNKDVEGQGNVFVEAHKKHPHSDNPLDIVFYLGDGMEEWTPNTVKKTGMGASETLAVDMAKRLAAQGHKVRVYSSCGHWGDGIYEGVEYYQTNKYQDLKCDVLVVSRRADALADSYNVQAKLKLLWVHDVFALNATNELLLKADKILALSEWHKQNIMKVHNVSDDHVLVTRNGIDLNRFDKNLDRNQFRVINSSSPDRSWICLLDCWKNIKEQVPEAELHLFYGFKNLKISAQQSVAYANIVNEIEHKMNNLKECGIVYHDRVSQEELAEEFLKSGVWAFPSWFEETFCCSAVEAQLAGCHMVTSNLAALKETVADRGVLLDGDWLSKEYQEKFISEVVKALKKTDGREELQQYAKEHFGLDSLAVEWEKMFNDLVEQVSSNPTIKYEPTTSYK